MSDGPSQIEGERGALSLLRDRFKNYKWAEEIASRYNATAERTGIVTERQGLVPVFIERKAISQLQENWRTHGGNEVGGWLVGEEETFNNHLYQHVMHVIQDPGRGNFGEFSFVGPMSAVNYVRQRRRQGERLVVIGSAHTHPAGWSGRITGSGRDSSVFATLDPKVTSGELWSKTRTHLILTPADNNAVDIWQAKSTNEPWEQRLVRNGHFILVPKATAQGKIRVLS